MSTLLRVSAVCGILLVVASRLPADERPSSIDSFLTDHCIDCHDGVDAEGGLDLAGLDGDLGNPKTMAQWIRIFDRVADGEMPPADAGELDQGVRSQFSGDVSVWLREAQAEQHASLGRVRTRRLTNSQLERTLHDLLGIDLPLANLMPDQQRTDGFAGVAQGQTMSHFHLESHLAVIDAALDAAFQRAAADDGLWSRRYTARELARENPAQRCRDPEMIDGKAVVWSSGLTFYGRITSTTVRKSGWYRITFSASAMNKPKNHGVWCTVRSGRCTSGAPLMSWIGSFEATDEPTEKTFQAWIPEGHMVEIRPGDATLRRARFRGGQVGAGEGGPQNVPGVALHAMSIEEVHPGGDVATARERLFGNLNVEFDEGQQKMRLVSDDPSGATARQLRAFARRAFRRPVSDQQLGRYLRLLRQSMAAGDEPLDALRISYRAILCSPRFLYFVEPPGALDDDAIANRLSYMLWGSMPDPELMELADNGKLHDPDEIRAQVDRMLAAPRGQRFVRDFADQWLDLVNIDFTQPDQKLYREFDLIVQNAMLEETQQFLQTLLDTNASAARLVDADFSFFNSRLARFYDMDEVSGDRLQRVSLRADSHRGGLLAQGAILKVSANGTNTSPVLRGIWVSERILGVPIPPPPMSVPAVEPDIRGAKTIRQQLEKHLADEACAVCHRKIDPPGYALENFDAAGQWRDRYRRVTKGRTEQGLPIDASFTLADGRAFEDFAQFRRLVASDPCPIARNFAEKLLIYGTGARITFVDRAAVQAIVEQTALDNYGLRSLLDAVVTSPTFLSK